MKMFFVVSHTVGLCILLSGQLIKLCLNIQLERHHFSKSENENFAHFWNIFFRMLFKNRSNQLLLVSIVFLALCLHQFALRRLWHLKQQWNHQMWVKLVDEYGPHHSNGDHHEKITTMVHPVDFSTF